MRVFLDTNVLVAAFATRGLCADVFRTVLAEHELVVGETILNELARVLMRRLGMPDARVHEVVAFVRQQAAMATETALPSLEVRDPSDAAVLAGAISGAADVLVTGDHDLLVLKRVKDLPIVDPRGFWEMVKRER